MGTLLLSLCWPAANLQQIMDVMGWEWLWTMLCTRIRELFHPSLSRDGDVVLVTCLLNIHTTSSSNGDLIAANVRQYSSSRISKGPDQLEDRLDPKRERSELGKRPRRKTNHGRGKRPTRRISNGRGEHVVLWPPRRTSNRHGDQAPRRTNNGPGKGAPRRTSSGQRKLELFVVL